METRNMVVYMDQLRCMSEYRGEISKGCLVTLALRKLVCHRRLYIEHGLSISALYYIHVDLYRGTYCSVRKPELCLGYNAM
jgi:hypothetical protein